MVWTCPCRSLSDHLVSLLEGAGVCQKRSPTDTTGLSPRSVSAVTCTQAPQQHHSCPSVSPHSESSRSEASWVAATAPSKWHSSRRLFRELGARPFRFGDQPHNRGYKSLISPAAHQRLERLSQRNEELCQQLSGCYHAFLLPSYSLPRALHLPI